MKADIAASPARYAACSAAKAAKPSQTLNPPDTTAIVTDAPRIIDAASSAPARYRIPRNRPSKAAARMVHQFTDRSLCLDSNSGDGRTYGPNPKIDNTILFLCGFPVERDEVPVDGVEN